MFSEEYKKKRQERILEIIKSGKYYADEDGNIYGKRKKKLSLNPNEKGYKMVTALDLNCKRIYFSVHQFVYLFFNGGYDVNLQINHKNCVKSDNRISNLELVTHTENARHAINNNRYKFHIGEDHSISKLTKEQVCEIRILLMSGMHQAQIAKHYRVCPGNISAIKVGKTWTHL